MRALKIIVFFVEKGVEGGIRTDVIGDVEKVLYFCENSCLVVNVVRVPNRMEEIFLKPAILFEEDDMLQSVLSLDWNGLVVGVF